MYADGGMTYDLRRLWMPVMVWLADYDACGNWRGDVTFECQREIQMHVQVAC